ncbi:hypothetical protein ACO0LF_29600 [Undibacterium sp. Di27W]|uniref:hypothetical protein n=1 Tax=Undibacterium sp. Di27W TaxID=3413036 RepID=UPI003BF1DEF5
MKMDDTMESIARFFNDLIGSILPGVVLAVGLSIMHLGPSKIAEASKSLENATLTLTVIGLMFAVGHILIAIFDLVFQPVLRACRILKGFDEVEAMERQSYRLFAELVNKFQSVDATKVNAEWDYKDLRSVALSVSAEGASLGRRFTFISLLCNGVGTALVIMLIDFLSCLALNQNLLFHHVIALNWVVQSVLILFASVALFKRGEDFYGKAMATPFSIAVAELKLKRENNVAE